MQLCTTCIVYLIACEKQIRKTKQNAQPALCEFLFTKTIRFYLGYYCTRQTRYKYVPLQIYNLEYKIYIATIYSRIQDISSVLLDPQVYTAIITVQLNVNILDIP
uniref:Uncharacterized protein n=1 Tax=Cacopsylla melanoneura TaxID=428564 RepID=A0A8D9BUA5_9HEMI